MEEEDEVVFPLLVRLFRAEEAAAVLVLRRLDEVIAGSDTLHRC